MRNDYYCFGQIGSEGSITRKNTLIHIQNPPPKKTEQSQESLEILKNQKKFLKIPKCTNTALKNLNKFLKNLKNTINLKKSQNLKNPKNLKILINVKRFPTIKNLKKILKILKKFKQS